MAKDKKPTETQDNQSETTKTKTPKGGFKAVIKKLVTNGKKRGFITYDEINNAYERNIVPHKREPFVNQISSFRYLIRPDIETIRIKSFPTTTKANVNKVKGLGFKPKFNLNKGLRKTLFN